MKRFYEQASAAAVEEGFTVQLDGRAIKTPAKAALLVPTEALAVEMAAEWQVQEEEIAPADMILNGLANAAIDRTGPRFKAVADEVAGYGGHDLLCYRADRPQELADRQAAAWDAHLNWAAAEFGADLQVTSGIVSVAQPGESLDRLRSAVRRLDAFTLTGLGRIVQATGSLVLALAVLHGRLEAAQAYTLSQIDEAWQAEQWGEDGEAAARRDRIAWEMQRLGVYLGLLGHPVTG